MTAQTFKVRGRLDLAILVAPAERQTRDTDVSPLDRHRSVLGQIDASLSRTFGDKRDEAGGEAGASGASPSVLTLIDQSVARTFEVKDGATSPFVMTKGLLESEGDVASLVKIEVLKATINRNPIGSADTFTFSCDWSGLPVDPRAYEGAQFQLWIYTHDDPERCRPGDPGNFGGVVDKARRNRRTKTIDFTCRDWTAIALEEELDPDDLASIDLDQELYRVVENVLDFMPNNIGWIVVPLGRLGTSTTPARAMAEEQRAQVIDIDIKYSQSEELKAAVKLVNAGADTSKYYTAPPVTLADSLRNQTQLDNPVVRGAIAAKGLDDDLTVKLATTLFESGVDAVNDVKGAVNTTFKVKPARTVKLLKKPKASQLFGRGRLKAWDAVVKVCALMGVSPEVAVTAQGEIGVYLVDVADLASGDTLRRFARRDANGRVRRHRVLTEGRTIGDTFQEERDLSGGRKIDYVQVSAPNPDTGRILGPVKFGRTRKQGTSKAKGVFLTVPGVTDEAHLARIARATYYDLAAGELRLKLAVDTPWSDGGNAADPDLLYCGPGAMFEIRFEGFEEAARVEGESSVAKILQLQGVDRESAELLEAAQTRAKTVPFFQVLRTVLRFDGEGEGSFATRLDLQTYVGAVTPPASSRVRQEPAAQGTKFEDLDDGG